MVASLCTPATVYIILSFMLIVVHLVNKPSLLYALFSVVITFLWAYFLNYLCTKGHTSVSWAIVVVPLIVLLVCLAFVVAFIIYAAKTKDQTQQPIQAQQPTQAQQPIQAQQQAEQLNQQRHQSQYQAQQTALR